MRAVTLSFISLSLAIPSLISASQLPLQVPTSYNEDDSLLAQDSWRAGAERYDDQQVWRVGWTGVGENAKKEVMSIIELLDLDVWHTTRSSLDVRLSPREAEVLSSYLPTSTFKPFIPDLQSLVDLSFTSTFDLEAAEEAESDDSYDDARSNEVDIEKKRKKKKKTKPAPKKPQIDPFNLTTIETPYHDAFHPIEDVYKFGQVLISTFNGKDGLDLQEINIGKTFEGRDIKGWTAKMTEVNGTQPQDLSKKRKKKHGGKGRGREREEDAEEPLELEIVVQAGQHGREWVGPSSALYFLHNLLLHATSHDDSDSRTLLKSFRFTVIPNINPDGYEYSRQHSRLWRKNRQDVGGKNGKCVGVDLNSNWGYKWRPSKHSSPCSETFPGREAFEAYETKAVSDYLAAAESRGNKVRAFIDLHSYGQLFMFPFAHSCDDFPPDAEMLMEAGLGVAKAMRTRQGEGYEAGQACDLTYRAPGDAIDYTYGVTDIRWSYSAELRDTGTYGFMLPPSLIRPTADEVTAGLLYLAKFIYVLEVNPPQTPRLDN
ncbi:hypothetical protein I316_03799 [Kwoniella heveanensis BCC8398]|uniref:Inactive metallocarboxypeptidase ECM14 n=1 Tax=Kwoniella heveanensis BCC8398 TaxID=1296120 RepID=A0A1B9GTD9_9TREE|nr:hypothetical protein I316_03799 [Kwoniella heveanensis BCC8398]